MTENLTSGSYQEKQFYTNNPHCDFSQIQQEGSSKDRLFISRQLQTNRDMKVDKVHP